jgi:lipopolysaccharide transport system ATP-binding protein
MMMNKFLFEQGWDKNRFIQKLCSMGRISPHFFILGFQKCGTTMLYDQLIKHPEFKAGLWKENDELSKRHYDLNKFLLSFPYKRGNLKTGDGSHLYTYAPYGLPRIKKYFPSSKLLVIMRNPVDRAFSHYNMDIKLGLLNKNITFSNYVDFEMKILENISDIYSIEELFQGTSIFKNAYGTSVVRGLYSIYMKKMIELGLEFYPICLERLKNDFENEFSKIIAYLEIEPWKIEMEVVNRGEYKDGLDPATRTLLSEFYEPFNQQLYALIGDNYDWK